MSPSNTNSSDAAGVARNISHAGIAEIVVLGARGRMGQMVLQACAQKIRANPGSLRVVGAVESPSSPYIGQPTGVDGIDVLCTDQLEPLLHPGVVVIDFSAPIVSLAALEMVKRKGAAHVLCTTGLNPAEKQIVMDAGQTVPIVYSPNMSMGVTVMFKVAEMVAKILGEDFDVEIIEAHHNQKKDSPSGTALGFAEAIARGHGVKLSDKANYGREGLVGARPKGEIGIHAVRGGDIVGDHTVLFAGDGERIELKHMAHSRQTFAQGAVKAALFLAGKPAGIYNMFDVLGL
jgi:4-hydroxy-tetrahydrodipicolinate reductase